MSKKIKKPQAQKNVIKNKLNKQKDDQNMEDDNNQ